MLLASSEALWLELSLSANRYKSQLQMDEIPDSQNGAEPEAATNADPGIDAVENEIRSNDTTSAAEIDNSELRNGEGNRTFTMRELYNDLKDGKTVDRNGSSEADALRRSTAASDGDRREASSSYRSVFWISLIRPRFC